MARFRFVCDREALVPDLSGAVLQPNQVFDPAEFGVPGWRPEPDPHPLFAEINGKKDSPAAPAAPQE